MELKLGNVVKTLVDKENKMCVDGPIFIPKDSIGIVIEPFENGALIEFKESKYFPSCIIGFDNNEVKIIK